MWLGTLGAESPRVWSHLHFVLDRRIIDSGRWEVIFVNPSNVASCSIWESGRNDPESRRDSVELLRDA